MLLNGTGNLVAKDMEKAEILRAFPDFFFAGKTSLEESQDPENSKKSPGQERLTRGGSG